MRQVSAPTAILSRRRRSQASAAASLESLTGRLGIGALAFLGLFLIVDGAQVGTFEMIDVWSWATWADELEAKVIPGYRGGAGSGTPIREREPQPARSGTGYLAPNGHQFFLRNHPEADCVAVEFSPNMRDLALARLSAYKNASRDRPYPIHHI